MNRLLGMNQLYLIPFNQMRDATLDQMSVQVVAAGGMTAKLRLGIYKNNADNDNYPGALLLLCDMILAGSCGSG
jgi:hypothetical protein